LFETPNFFAKYRHYIILEASSSTEDDQIQWYGHVESKVRHLVGNLEREALELAHVWPKTYPSLEEGKEKTTCYWFIGLVIKTSPATPVAGEAPANAQINLDLTTPIRVFCELVMRGAITIKMWKEGMRVEAVYRKRRQLIDYLPLEERAKLKPERKSVSSLTPNAGTGVNSPKSNIPIMSTEKISSISNTGGCPQGSANLSSTPISGKRRPSDPIGGNITDTPGENSSNGASGCEQIGITGVASPNEDGDSIADAQPPSKRINTDTTAAATTTSEIINGLQVS